VRKIAAILLATAFVVSLAACSDLPAQVQNCVTPYAAGNGSKSITAPGVIGHDPKTKIPTPTVAGSIEVSTVKHGSGLELGPNDIADVQLSLYDAGNGKILGSTKTTSGYTRGGAIQSTVGSKQVLAKALQCQTVGSRVVTLLTAADYFGSAATATSDGISPKLVIVAVEDIIKGYRGRATGTLQPLQSGFPSVVTSANGTPGVTLDLQEPPKTAQHELVRGGSGAVVKAGQQVLLQVQAIAWTSPAPTSTFDSTWKTLTPRYYTLTALKKNSGGESLDAASVKALVGDRVGSQVLVVVPPKDGYPSGKAPTGYPSGETLIFVYDILGVY
jgi:hypothetical protein